MDEAPSRNHKLTIGVANDERFVSVSVADTRPGITPEQFARLFEPFFTTKVAGLRLGLSISRRSWRATADA